MKRFIMASILISCMPANAMDEALAFFLETTHNMDKQEKVAPKQKEKRQFISIRDYLVLIPKNVNPQTLDTAVCLALAQSLNPYKPAHQENENNQKQ